MGTRDPRVDVYIENAAPFAQPVLRHLREVVHSAAPDIEETLKWGIPHFMHDGIVCSMAAFKQHCTFGFWKHALVVKDGGESSSDAMGSFGRITPSQRYEYVEWIAEAKREDTRESRLATALEWIGR